MVSVERTPIPGLLVVHLDVHEDARGWFKENWQRAKMTALGLPDFGPVQNNIAFNARRGVTRGVHAEPWDKLVSVATGRAFGAWVDLRVGETFGRVFTLELDPDIAVFVPRGVGNAYQVLDDATAYSYLVNDHWRPDAPYTALNLADPSVGIDWPIPLDAPEVELSERDLVAPPLAQIAPMLPKKMLVLGAGGQLGRALAAAFPGADATTRDQLDITDGNAIAAWPWSDYGLVVNAAAYTNVDEAETPLGRAQAWAANATASALLAWVAREHQITLVSYSTDYVFDGIATVHDENEPLAPLGVYGQSKAAGDLAVTAAPRHYILRASWVVGEGRNFVRTMQRLAAEGVSPKVVDDQIGRLTFTSTLVDATRHLLTVGAPYGVYHVSNGGQPMSWRAIAAEVFALSGRSPDDVIPTTASYYRASQVAQGRAFATRPANSTLNLAKLHATGFIPPDHLEALRSYLAP
jgi:dTDP-4-dehydrorhamnose 3,5-epimerase